ncbi:MAG TPA: FeoA family protein [Calditrichia bacterium]|nr:ferrous iron transport protein A [Calditrichota bacterium]HQV32965.1 FeoA family protein [Calditrichia bacterium]
MKNLKNLISLDLLKKGEKAVVRGFGKSAAGRIQLMELGLMSGTPLRLVKSAPLGDPLEIAFRGFHLSIRKDDARAVLVEKVAER